MTAEQERLLIHIRRIAAGLLIMAAVAGACFARDFLLPAVFAVFIATTLRPVVRGLSRRGIPAWATTAGIVLAGALRTYSSTRPFGEFLSQRQGNDSR